MNDHKPLPKSEWGPGPWQDEPDRIEFEHQGFPCLLRRSQVGGNWCGYVAIPPGHPYYKVDFDKIKIKVHGGLTYSAHCADEICHVPKPGEPDDVWWLGFDCGHAFDQMPAMNKYLQGTFFNQGYKTLQYVKHETMDLADQLAAL